MSVLVRALYTGDTLTHTHMIWCSFIKEIYYEKLAHVLMEADRSQGPQGELVGPAQPTVQFPSGGPHRLKTQEEPMFHFSSEGRKKKMPRSKTIEQGRGSSILLTGAPASLLYSGLHLIG